MEVSTRLDVMDAPIIGFRPYDKEGIILPHNDVLMGRTTLANYKVKRILVDVDSSVNILFKKDFDRM